MGQDIASQVSLRVAHYALKLQQESLSAEKKSGRTRKPARVREQVCRYFGLSSSTYTAIMRSILDPEEAATFSSGKDGQGRTGNRLEKKTRIPSTDEVRSKVQLFLRERRKRVRRVIGRQILDFFIEEGIINVEKDNNQLGQYDRRSFESALRATRGWLVNNGYKRGRRKGGNVALERIFSEKGQIPTDFV